MNVKVFVTCARMEVLGTDQGVSSSSKLCLTLVGCKQKVAKPILIDICGGVTLQIEHGWTIDF